MNFKNRISQHFKSFDRVGKPAHKLLHYQNDIQQKSVLGGICTLLIKGLFIWIALE